MKASYLGAMAVCTRITLAGSMLPQVMSDESAHDAAAAQLHEMQLAFAELIDILAASRPEIIHALAHRLYLPRPLREA